MSRACCLCDQEGNNPFDSVADLAAHVAHNHQRRMCVVCLEVGFYNASVSVSMTTCK